jgi:hypothetical protein
LQRDAIDDRLSAAAVAEGISAVFDGAASFCRWRDVGLWQTIKATLQSSVEAVFWLGLRGCHYAPLSRDKRVQKPC